MTATQFIDVGAARIAYRDEGEGPPLLLLHGCPFSSFVWRKVIALLSPHFRCIAPDLLGLGDTETRLDADWSLPAQARSVLTFLDALSAVGYLAATAKAAPIMWSLKTSPDEKRVLKQKLDRFAYWHAWRTAFQIAAFIALLWALA